PSDHANTGTQLGSMDRDCKASQQCREAFYPKETGQRRATQGATLMCLLYLLDAAPTKDAVAKHWLSITGGRHGR
ncbi:hypothetical protein, partial [Xanthomonas euvesicatoria]|uniref:hypothetical protein n=1 Tax=Xanthomonas euvesicatoria TaxID=456327 RepID=UPI0030C7A7B6